MSLEKKRKLQVGFCSDCFNSFKVTKLMREGNCSVSDDRTGSGGLKLRKERSDQLLGNTVSQKEHLAVKHTHSQVTVREQQQRHRLISEERLHKTQAWHQTVILHNKGLLGSLCCSQFFVSLAFQGQFDVLLYSAVDA